MMKILSNLRMRTQIIIFQIFVLVLVMGLVGTGNLTQRLIFQYAMSASSEQIIKNSDIREIGLASTLISEYIKQRLLRSILLVDHLAQIIYFYSIQEDRIENQYHLDPCVTQEQFLHRKYLSNVQKFCYQIHGTDDLLNLTSSGDFLLNSLSLLDNFGLIFNIYNPNFLQMVDFQNQTFDSLYPFGMMIKNYDPRTRQWYKNHIEGMKKQPWEHIFFSDIFQIMYAGSSYQIAITQSLINQKKEVLGILKTQLSISDKDFINSNINILLINQQGQVIYNGLDKRKNISEIFYIYNQSITGFNSSDWYQIEEKAKKHSFLHLNEQYFILFDKYSQEYVHVHCQKLEKQNFTLIIYTNVSSIQLMQDEYQQIQDKFDMLRQIANTAITFLGLVLCFISIFIIKCICQPLVDLNTKISQHLLTLGNNISQQFFKITHKNLNSTNILTNLNFQFQNFYEILQRNNNKKCEQCKLFEKMKYNLKENNIDLTEININARNLQTCNKRLVNEIFQQIFKCGSLYSDI